MEHLVQFKSTIDILPSRHFVSTYRRDKKTYKKQPHVYIAHSYPLSNFFMLMRLESIKLKGVNNLKKHAP